ncbi:MAG TPA: proton-conducting transporter membrane subunit [Candidatus Nanopelagicaceae bacterium]|nr:proton-conducting transporter membrane subunit [Candidatus Nanopelagicaceae bacterium]
MNLAFVEDFGPIAILVLGAVICSWLDLGGDSSFLGQRHLSRWVALGALVLAFLASVGFWKSSFGSTPPDIEHGSFLIDRFALFFYPVGLAAAGALILTGADTEAELEPHVGLYHALLLVSAAGVLFTASSADMVSLAVGLSMTSLPLLVALGLRKTDPGSMRLAVRSLAISGALVATFVGGEAILAGMAQSTELRALAQRPLPVDPLVALAAVLVLVGAVGQLGVVPFGVWRAGGAGEAPLAPSIGRTVMVALAALAALLRILPGGLGGVSGTWGMTVAVLAGATLILAPLAALRQRRLTAVVSYLLVAQLALALVALPEVARPATASVLYLLLCFVPMATASLGLLGAIATQGYSDSRASLRGLWARSPILAGVLAGLLVALAGAPPVAGFFARLFTVESALQAGLGWLVWLALLSAVLSAIVAFRWLLVLFDSRVDGPELGLPGRTAMIGIGLSGAAVFSFAILLGPLMAIAARAAIPPLFGP